MEHRAFGAMGKFRVCGTVFDPWPKPLPKRCMRAKPTPLFMEEQHMNAYGYDVKWEPHQKYITYTTPENIRCRDSKLFDQTLKRENMELYFRLGGADYLQACREIAYDHREPTPALEDAVCGMAGTVAAICALCEDEDSEVSDLARELYYSSLLLQELVEWYQSRRQEQENYEEEYEQYHGFDMTIM